jgi:predicted RNA-binding protein YlxR (DUF448 family)
MPKQKGPRPKHVPQRTCIACRKTENKRGLIRLVRLQDERVAIDPTGKRSGRGAYLCSDRACWETALKRKAVERALKIEQLHPDDQTALRDYAGSLPPPDKEGIEQRVPISS